jgi:hypothetical protein
MAKNALISTPLLAPSGSLHHYFLPRGILGIRIAKAGSLWTFDAPVLSLRPDPAHKYFLQYNASAWREDTINVEFTPEGFLKSLKTEFDDKTDEVMTKIAGLAEVAAQSVTATQAALKTRGLDAAIQVIYEGPLDPFDAASVKTLEDALKAADPSATFSITPERKSGEDNSRPESQERAGIFCRPLAFCGLTLRAGSQTLRHEVQMPDASQLHFIEIPTAPMVKSDFEILFDKGMPVKITMKKPSSALSFMEAPLSLLKALLSLPATLFQFRINLGQQQVIERQKELEFQKEMQKVQEEFRQLQLSNRAAAEAPQTPRGLGGNGAGPADSTTRSGGEGSADASKVAHLEQRLKILSERLHELEEKSKKS